MKKTIDCLLIGHNESNFQEYEQNIKEMGQHSGAYRDLNLNFIRYGNKPYTAPEIFNLFYSDEEGSNGLHKHKPLHIGETFSAAIAYLGTYLNRRGYTFDYVNAFQAEKEELAAKLQEENILTVAIITTYYVAVFPIIEILDFIKTYNQTAKIIIGGPFIYNQVIALEPSELEFLFKSLGADFYVHSSQGENALVKIIHALKNDLPVDHINNVYFKNGKRYVKTPLLKEDNQLSQNMADWRLFSHRIGEFVNIRTAISCPFSCAFCGFPEHAGKYQTAGVEHVEKELNRLARIKPAANVQFTDDTFNVPIKRFKEILRMIIKNKFKFRWHSHFRCQFADLESVELMKESGCEGVYLGIESGNDQILQNMNKAAATEKYYRGIELLKKYGILTYGSFIIGFPGETEETAADTITFVKESGLDFYRCQLWYCDTLTPIWKQREKYNITGSHFEWSHNTMDAKTAGDIINRIFLEVEQPTWVPQYNFDYDGIFHLLQRGLSLQQLQHFLKSFNNGVREKLTTPSAPSNEVSFKVIKQLKKYCRPHGKIENDLEQEIHVMDKYDVGFDY